MGNHKDIWNEGKESQRTIYYWRWWIHQNENYVEKMALENGKQNRTGIFQGISTKNTTENMKGTPIRLKVDKMEFNRSCNKEKNKSTKRWDGQYRKR
jgi:hypothetical protein